MIVLEKQISMAELASMAAELYGDMVKAVADVAENTLAIDAELHSDLERLLLESGSQQNNRSRYVESEEIREKIIGIVNKFIGR